MGALLKSSTWLAAAIAIGVYLYGSPGVQDVEPAPPARAGQDIAAARTSKTDIAQELDALAARQIDAPDVRRAYLADHPAGAPLARAEVDGHLDGADGLAHADAKTANGVAVDAKATSAADPPAAPSAATEAATANSDEVCKRDEERLARLGISPSSEEAARFLNELGCEKLRLLALIGDLSGSAPASAVGDVAKDAASDAQAAKAAEPPAAPSAEMQVAAAAPDEVCKRDEERLGRLRANPSAEDAARFLSELGCETLRPQLLALIGDWDRSAPAAAVGDVAAADPPAAPPAEMPVAAAAPDELCKRDGERFEHLRANPSAEEAARFLNELGCEVLRPQLLALVGDLERSAPAAAVGDVVAADPPAAPSEEKQIATAPDEVCKRDEERLEQLRANPSAEDAARFLSELGCETLRPQLLALIGDLDRSAPAAAVVATDVKATNAADPPAAPSAAIPVAAATLDEVCKHDEERLARLRADPSEEEAARFTNELRCATLRPQLSRLAESLGYAGPTPTPASEGSSDKGSRASAQQADSDCISERDTLDRIRAQPSADAAQHLWRDLRCERLRPQVRLLLESLNDAADPTGACRREAAELDRIRTNPNRSEAEGFARDMTCNALKPQAARLLESLAD